MTHNCLNECELGTERLCGIKGCRADAIATQCATPLGPLYLQRNAIELNINDIAAFKLAPHGLRIFVSKYDQRYRAIRHPGWDTGSQIVMPLWEVMQTFGAAMLPGNEQVFQDNRLTFTRHL